MFDWKFFQYKETQIKVLIDQNGTPWWDASQICQILGYTTRAAEVVEKLESDEKLLLERKIFDVGVEPTSKGGAQKKWFVNEPGLYSLILRSDKAEAKLFKRWVTHEVLPHLRKHGHYEIQSTSNSLPSSFSSAIQETIQTTINATMQEVVPPLIHQTVRATLSEIRSEDPVYIAAKKTQVLKELHALKPLPDAEITLAQKNILTLILPEPRESSIKKAGLTHSVEFLYEKKLAGYTWSYKNIETAGGQLTKIAKTLWEKDGYKATEETISMDGRTVSIWLYPIEYAEKALAILVEKGKIFAPAMSEL